MKLYYAPGSCALSPHIVAREAGLPVELVKVDLKTKKAENGRDFNEVNPKGYVPALELDSGEVLTEGPAIVQYLADLAPGSGLAPANGTLPRYHVQEALAFIGTELHKTYSPLFNPATTDDVREDRKAYLRKRYAYVESILAKQGSITADPFTVADAYLFTVTSWARVVGLDLSAFPALLAFQKRVGERTAVRQALFEQGLTKAP